MADNDNEQEEQEQAVVVYRYLSQHNPNNSFYPGVPPGDILKDAYDGYPKWIQRSIDESPMYRKVEPKKAAAPKKAAPAKKAAAKPKAQPKAAPKPAPKVELEPEPEPVVIAALEPAHESKAEESEK